MSDRYFLHLAYRGTAYRGWQRQPGVHSVQEQVEDTLSRILNQKITVTACGRTDAGVHARQFYVHTNIENKWDYDLKFRLNKNLLDDIAFYDIIPVHERAHARNDATLRTYDYFIHHHENPFLNPISSLYNLDLNVEAMAEAALLLTQYNDFAGLCKSPVRYENTICEVSDVKLYVNPNKDLLRFQISADRFLRGMVRIIVHELLEIGQGHSGKDRLEAILRDNAEVGEKFLAHPQGLHLSEVHYSYINMPTKTDIFSSLDDYQNLVVRV